MNGPADLKTKRALITGASGGLGAHFARTLARAGVEVIVAARRVDKLRQVVDEIRATGGQAHAVQLDVREAESVVSALEAAGPIDILVNNAGIANTKAALEQTEADWDVIVDTNLKGAWLVSTETARRMRAHGTRGVIINIASILGLRQSGRVSPYAISKAAMIQMTKQLALELARYHIRVNALAPGYIETELNQEFLESESSKDLLRRIPQRRFGRAEDLDGPILLLASDASRYVTGAVLPVDGGHLLSQI